MRLKTPIRKSEDGFTLVELMVVMLIIGILAAVAIPSFVAAIKSAKEASLKEDLHVMRDAIDSYTMDKNKAPQSLDDLVQNGYLKEIPQDPFTHSREWGMRSDQDDPKTQSWGGQNVFDVYSKTTDKAADGTCYCEW